MADRLKRDVAGTYHSSDGRFTVQREGPAWYVSDSDQTDELGMPRLFGPFATLEAAQSAIEDQPAPEAKRLRRSAR